MIKQLTFLPQTLLKGKKIENGDGTLNTILRKKIIFTFCTTKLSPETLFKIIAVKYQLDLHIYSYLNNRTSMWDAFIV